MAAPLIAKAIQWPASTVGTVLSCALFFAFLLVGNEVSRFFLLKFFRGRENGPADGAVGAMLGFGKAAAVLFAVLSALLFFDKPHAKPANGYDAAMKNSRAVAFVGRHNLFANLNIPALAEPLKPSRRASKRRASAAP